MNFLDTKQLKRLSTKRLLSLFKRVREVRIGERNKWAYYTEFLGSINASPERIERAVKDFDEICCYYNEIKSVLNGREHVARKVK